MLSLAKRFVYAHNDIDQLEDRLNKALQIVEKTGGGILVITEGLFGMKGDTGKLDKIIALKEKYPFRLLVDDAHGFGIMGKSGIGTGEYYGVQDKIDVLFNTFAKSMALVGAFVSGDKKVINFLRYNLRSQIYAKSLPLPIIIGALKRLELLKNAHKERKHLWDISTALQTGLRNNGFYLGDINSPITPLYMSPSPEITMYPILDLRDNYHIFVSAVVYPVVEKGIIIFRMIPTAEHSFEDVNYTIQSFGEIGNKIATNYYTPALAN
jgi:glycine C-acetyltransferase